MHTLTLMCLVASAGAADVADIVQRVNAANAGWRAQRSARFSTTDQARALCGTLRRGDPGYVALDASAPTPAAENLPASFDGRTAFPNCPAIGKVRDQAHCGSCWVFAGVSMYEGRWCAHTGVGVDLSELDVMSCLGGGGPCHAGFPSAAAMWCTGGVVTGGSYGEDTCKPYPFAPCGDHDGAHPEIPDCPPDVGVVPNCTKTCQDGYAVSYEDDKVSGGTARSAALTVDALKATLLKGPVAATMTVYEDFVHYKSGVYKHVTGAELGGHGITVIGYGSGEGGEPYFLCKNSWNDSWGADGFFKIDAAQLVGTWGFDAAWTDF